MRSWGLRGERLVVFEAPDELVGFEQGFYQFVRGCSGKEERQ